MTSEGKTEAAPPTSKPVISSAIATDPASITPDEISAWSLEHVPMHVAWFGDSLHGKRDTTLPTTTHPACGISFLTYALCKTDTGLWKGRATDRELFVQNANAPLKARVEMATTIALEKIGSRALATRRGDWDARQLVLATIDYPAPRYHAVLTPLDAAQPGGARCLETKRTRAESDVPLPLHVNAQM
jgi:hypothetical protein